MKTWYVKDLSKATKVSVQTLHYYDKIGLLEPSLRHANGYRCYGEKDLMKLQQIVALKFFGFPLSKIKAMLEHDISVYDSFLKQAQFLEENAKALMETSRTLNDVISDCDRRKSVPWETIIKLIEVYRMTKELEKTWAGKIFSPEELKQYASFEQELKTNYTLAQKEAFEKEWGSLVAQVSDNLTRDPGSDFGIAIGKQMMDLINGLYGKKYAGLRTAIWEKGFKTGQMDAEHAVPVPVVDWLDKAADAYYRNAIYSVLSKVGSVSSGESLKAWDTLLENMFGDDQAAKNEVVECVFKEDKVSEAAKKWLRENYKGK
ncbi:MAG: MerR family transcriptional regulator [Verrucomicrobia bacterium]|nr:MAG: MerR family transcriptional regulator [Verrucomicrobiota bacterium]